MGSLSASILNLVASPVGILVLALLDSTPLLALPGGVDAAVIVLAARRDPSPWAVVLLATAGSLAGAIFTFWIGAKAGEHGLERYIRAKRLDRIRAKVRNVGAFELALLDLLPPPFPFTAFILAAGALEVDRARFFRTLAVCRLGRFGVEAMLAVIYGEQIVAWFDSDLFRDFAVICCLIAVAVAAVSLAQLFRSSRRAAVVSR